ncbi:MAG TPA: hypothetical protein VJN43_00970 [Bryobacteraceae bacterium]|nr:hypothetical protein [Bryobacteraceae bacterium]
MNVRKIALIGGAFFAFTTASYFALRAQGPLYDKVTVDLPYTITVNNTTLQPGHYVIQQMPSTDISNRVLQVYSNDGTKLETSVMTIPTVNNTTPSDTQVVLNHIGNDYYFDKIWIQGKDYGYEFVLPENVKSRAQESQVAVNVPATYQSAPAPEQGSEGQSASANSNQSSAENQSAMNNPPSAANPSAQTTSPEAQASTAEPVPSQSTVTAPNSQTPSTAEAQQQNPSVSSQSPNAQQSQENPSLSAQATQQPAQPETTEQPAPQAQEQTPTSPSQAEPNSTTPSQATAPSGEQTESRNRQMPQTAANWLTLLFSGAGLSGAGMMLRRWIH